MYTPQHQDDQTPTVCAKGETPGSMKKKTHIASSLCIILHTFQKKINNTEIGL